MPSTNLGSFSWLLQQFQLKPGKPAFVYGLRAILALGVPIAVGIITGNGAASAMSSTTPSGNAVMAAMFVNMVDVGGAYRQKATAMIAATIGVTVAFLLANLVSSSIWLALPTTFIVIFLAGLAGLFGSVAASVSLVISIMYVVALAKFASFPDLSAVLWQCLLSLAGGIWAMVLSLGLWTIRPYTPVMESVAKCYLSLSKFVELASQRVLNPEDIQNWTKQFLQAQDTVTQDLTDARNNWASVWTRQKTVNLRGNQLLILIEDANQIINSVVAEVELLAIASPSPLFSGLQSEIWQVMAELAIALQTLSTAIVKGRSSVHLQDLDRKIEALEHQWLILRSQVVNRTNNLQTDEYADLVNLRKIANSLTKLTQQLHTDAEIVANLRTGKRHSHICREISPPQPSEGFSWINTLRDNLNFDSVLFRHALRLALITTIAELVAYVLQFPTGYWVTLTAVVALKPNFGGTTQTTVQRVLGTFVGGIIGIALVVLIKNPLAIAIWILLLMFTAMSVRSLSYSLFTMMQTPVIILLLNVISTGGWQIGVLRIVDTLAGGVLVLLGSYLLFPRWERQQLPTQLEKTIRANLVYFQQVIANYLNSRQDTADAINKLRHQAAIENANAEAAAQRLFSEPRHVQGEIEPVMTLMIYIRAFFSSVTTLGEHLQEFSGDYQFTELRRLADAIIQVLENLAQALQQQQPPQPLPELDSDLEAIHNEIEQLHTVRISEITTNPHAVTPTLQAVREQTTLSTELERIVNEVKIMHCAIALLQK